MKRKRKTRNPIQYHLGRTIRRQTIPDKRRKLRDRAERRDS